MKTRRANVLCLASEGPDDTALLRATFDDRRLAPETIVAILGKTEGNGCVNDFTRGYAVQSFRQMLSGRLPRGRVDRIAFVMSGGTEGGLSPHWLVFSVSEAGEPPEAGGVLAAAVARSRRLEPREIDRRAQAEAERNGHAAATSETLKSMGLARGAAALGVAMALGEVSESAVTDLAVAGDPSL